MKNSKITIDNLNLTAKDRIKILLEIKVRLDLLVEHCSGVRTLSIVFAYYDDLKNIVLNLDQLKGSWDIDRRPIIDNKIIKFIDFKNFRLVNEKHELIDINNLENNDLFKLNIYFEMMVPLSSGKLNELIKNIINE